MKGYAKRRRELIADLRYHQMGTRLALRSVERSKAKCKELGRKLRLLEQERAGQNGRL